MAIYNKIEKQRWLNLLQEERQKVGLKNHNIPALKAAQEYVEQSGATLVLVERPFFPPIGLSRAVRAANSKQLYNAILTVLNWAKLLPKAWLKKYRKPFNTPKRGTVYTTLWKNYTVNESIESDNYYAIKNGYRCDDTESKHLKKMYVFGSSLVFSIGCNAHETLPAFIQKQLGTDAYSVVNKGVLSADFLNSIFAILDTPINKGDLVLLYGLYPLKRSEKKAVQKSLHYIDLSKMYVGNKNLNNVFFDRTHLTPLGNSITAEALVRALKPMLNKTVIAPIRPFTEQERQAFLWLKESRFTASLRYIDEDFPGYIAQLKARYKPGINGIAAMNCNPFTLGHQYLIECAAKQVDTLYIFVVEEDKSIFPFNQRLQMIKAGVRHLSNVEVVTTGKFVVSSLTFPDYFTKEEVFNPNMNVDYDFQLFVHYIAPTLQLKVRFIGTEPFCKTTARHHEVMKKTLPPQGISVVEINRLTNAHGAISASKVRALLKQGDLTTLRHFLPETTTQFLKQHVDV